MKAQIGISFKVESRGKEGPVIFLINVLRHRIKIKSSSIISAESIRKRAVIGTW